MLLSYESNWIYNLLKKFIENKFIWYNFPHKLVFELHRKSIYMYSIKNRI